MATEEVDLGGVIREYGRECARATVGFLKLWWRGPRCFGDEIDIANIVATVKPPDRHEFRAGVRSGREEALREAAQLIRAEIAWLPSGRNRTQLDRIKEEIFMAAADKITAHLTHEGLSNGT